MRERLTVTTNTAGTPEAEVPCTSMWDLVEYLSYHRVGVNYRYEASHFTVTFPRLDLESAQRIMNGWSNASHHVLQTA